MGVLADLLDKARAVLARPKPVGSAHDAVARSELDNLVYDQMLAEAPALRQLAEDLSMSHAGTQDLVRDVMMGFYQPNPKVRDRTEMAPNRLANWTVSDTLATTPQTAETREYTVGSKYGATMATIGVTSRLDELLSRAKEVERKSEETEQAQESQAQANERLQQAISEAAAAQAAFDEAQANGDDTTGAQSAVDAAALELGMLTERADVAGDAVDIASQQAQQAAEKASRQMQAAIATAAAEAGKELAAENQLLSSWGHSPGEIERMSFAERRDLVQKLKASEVSNHLDLLGRFQFCERSTRAKRMIPGRDEVYAVERSGRLNDVLASDLANLAHPVLHVDFISRLSEGQILTRAYHGTEKAGKGAVLFCVDTSGSMRRLSAWSKAFALALLQRCKADKRDFVGIIFGSRNQVRVFRFPASGYEFSEVLDFVSLSFNGGTDFETPIDEAVDILEAEYNTVGKKQGDILFLTDDECRVSDAWYKRYKERKTELGYRFWGIAVGRTVPGSTLTKLSDNVRGITEFIDPNPVKDLMAAI